VAAKDSVSLDLEGLDARIDRLAACRQPSVGHSPGPGLELGDGARMWRLLEVAHSGCSAAVDACELFIDRARMLPLDRALRGRVGPPPPLLGRQPGHLL